MYLQIQLSICLFVPTLQRPVSHHDPMVTRRWRESQKGDVWKVGNGFWSKGYFSSGKRRGKVQQKMKFEKRKKVKSQRSLKLQKRLTQARRIAPPRKGRKYGEG